MTGVPTHNPVPLARVNRTRGAGVLTAAFMDDPMYRALFPDDGDRRRSLGLLWHAIIGYSRVYGEVYTTPALEGIACWTSPGNTTVTLWKLVRTGFGLQRMVMRFNPESRRRMMAVLSVVEAMHHKSIQGPHWYLWALGVAPESRRHGIGGALLEPVLADADLSGTPCYLETQTEQNVGFYEKRGFRVAHEAEPDLPGIRLWSMVREPR